MLYSGVIYTSRTHSQLTQVVRELKRLQKEGYNIKMSVMGGRATTCLHSVVKREKVSAIQQGKISVDTTLISH